MKIDISELNKDEILKRVGDEIPHLDDNMTKEQIVHWTKVWEKCEENRKLDELCSLIEDLDENVKRLHKGRMETTSESAISERSGGKTPEENDEIIRDIFEEGGLDRPNPPDKELDIPQAPRPDERGREDGR